jgi:hypothetical protein
MRCMSCGIAVLMGGLALAAPASAHDDPYKEWRKAQERYEKEQRKAQERYEHQLKEDREHWEKYQREQQKRYEKWSKEQAKRERDALKHGWYPPGAYYPGSPVPPWQPVYPPVQPVPYGPVYPGTYPTIPYTPDSGVRWNYAPWDRPPD